MKKRRIPPMLSDLVQTTLTSCDGILFDQCGVCPHCGGELSGYDIKKKQFAIVMEGEQKRVVTVLVKRFLLSALRAGLSCQTSLFTRIPGSDLRLWISV